MLHILGTVAFQADLDIYTSIPIGSVVVFDVVDLNIGSGWVHWYPFCIDSRENFPWYRIFFSPEASGASFRPMDLSTVRNFSIESNVFFCLA